MFPETLPPDWPHLIVQVVQRPGRIVCVTGHGEIDATTVGVLTHTLDAVLRQENPEHIDVNLADVTFMDSAGINALMACRAQAKPAGCRITVSQPRPMVRRVLTATGVHRLFGVR